MRMRATVIKIAVLQCSCNSKFIGKVVLCGNVFHHLVLGWSGHVVLLRLVAIQDLLEDIL